MTNLLDLLLAHDTLSTSTLRVFRLHLHDGHSSSFTTAGCLASLRLLLRIEDLQLIYNSSPLVSFIYPETTDPFAP
jgi:hypothetical protein